MNLTIRGNDVEISDRMRALANKRVEGFDRLLGNVVDAKLELRRVHQRSTNDAIAAQFTVQTGRHVLRAEERDGDTQKAIDSVIDKLERQARRYHERRADRHGPRPNDSDQVPAIDVEFQDPDEPVEIASLVRRKRFVVKPMDPEEAIEQMELLGHDFFLFHNAEDEQINVVYRRRNGTYGLLAPERG